MEQKTIKEVIELSGIGIHTGEYAQVRLVPEPAGTGIRFMQKGVGVELSPGNVVNTNGSTDIGKNGVRIKTVEHLLCAMHLLGIDNLTIEMLKGEEIPAYDGSAGMFYEVLKENVVGLGEEGEEFFVSESVRVEGEGAFIEVQPYNGLEITYTGVFRNSLGVKRYTFRGNPKDIVYARTFCYYEDVEAIIKAGKGRGGNLTNTLVLTDDGVMNPDGFRYPEEPVRHKILDIVGDLYLLGKPFRGRVISYMGGHALNFKLISKLYTSLTPAVA